MVQPKESPKRSRYFVESLARGLAILATFSQENKNLGLTEISQLLTLNKSTVFRLLATLQDLGYVYRDEHTKRYQPTYHVLRLGLPALDGIALRRIALPHMQALSQKHNESVSLAVLASYEIIYLERVQTSQLLSVHLAVGSRLPAYCTSMGKVLLAYQPPSRLNQILKEIDFVRRGPNTILTPKALSRDLGIIRQRGYSINDEELAAGVRSTAAPIRSRSGEVIAALNVAFPSARVSLEQLKRVFAPNVVATAEAISSDWATLSPGEGSQHIDFDADR